VGLKKGLNEMYNLFSLEKNMKFNLTHFSTALLLIVATPTFAAGPAIEVENSDPTLQVSAQNNVLTLSGEVTQADRMTVRIAPFLTLPEYGPERVSLYGQESAYTVAQRVKGYVESSTAYEVIVTSTDELHAQVVVEEPANIPTAQPNVIAEGACSDSEYLRNSVGRFDGLANVGNTVIFRRDLAGWQWVSDGESGGTIEPSGVGVKLPRLIDLATAQEAQSSFGARFDSPTSMQQAAETLASVTNNDAESGYTALVTRIVSTSGEEIGWAVTFELRPNMLILND
jgi:hypothetical protein